MCCKDGDQADDAGRNCRNDTQQGGACSVAQTLCHVRVSHAGLHAQHLDQRCDLVQSHHCALPRGRDEADNRICMVGRQGNNTCIAAHDQRRPNVRQLVMAGGPRRLRNAKPWEKRKRERKKKIKGRIEREGEEGGSEGGRDASRRNRKTNKTLISLPGTTKPQAMVGGDDGGGSTASQSSRAICWLATVTRPVSAS
jgi:hypothetical protein